MLSGEQLTKLSLESPFGYIASHNADAVAKVLSENQEEIQSFFYEKLSSGTSLLLSNEGWVNSANLFEKTSFFGNLGFPVEILLYVRPTVEWVNSAWWQWGAWANVPFQRWLDKAVRQALWIKKIQSWERVPSISKVNVRLSGQDIVHDFCTFLNLNTMERVVSNSGLPGSVLRLFQRFPALRPGPHDSKIDFILSKYLKIENDKTPWVLNENMVKRIMKDTRDSNNQILPYMEEDQAEIVKNDPRWIDEEFYSEKLVEPAFLNHELHPAKLEELTHQLIKVIVNIDKKLSQNNE